MPDPETFQQCLFGFYPNKAKLYEHTLVGGRLVETKIFHKNGKTLHRLTASAGYIKTSENFG
jgi:antitoxin component YwqK of YwqJK toxin-antitoxin module